MRALHIGIKDLTITLRDKGALTVLLGMPMALIFILGSALGGGGASLSAVKVAIVDLDRGPTGERVTDPFFTDERLTDLFDTRRMRRESAARAAVQRGDLAAALVVPRDFTKRLNAADPVELTVYTDPASEISAGVFRSVVQSVCTQVSVASVAVRATVHYIPARQAAGGGAGEAIQRAIASATETEALDAVTLAETSGELGREVSTLDYYGAGMSVMFLLFGSMYGAFSLVRERQDWTLPRMLTSPARKADIIGGKVLGVFAVGVAQWTVLFVFTLMLGVDWGPSPPALWSLALATVAAAAGLSVLLSALGTSVRTVSGIAPLVVQVMALLGGSMFPVEAFPEWLQPLHYFTVNGWALDGMLAVMRGGGFADAAPGIAALLALGAVFFGIGVWRLRWR